MKCNNRMNKNNNNYKFIRNNMNNEKSNYNK